MADDATLTITLDLQTAERLARLAQDEGVSSEQFLADLVADVVQGAFADGPPALMLSDEEFVASIERQRREIAEGRAVFYSHDEVMGEASAIIDEARAAKL